MGSFPGCRGEHVERRVARGVVPAHVNAMAESIIALYKAEVIHRRDRWDSLEQVEWEAMRWVAWFNHDRTYEALGDIPSAEF